MRHSILSLYCACWSCARRALRRKASSADESAKCGGAGPRTLQATVAASQLPHRRGTRGFAAGLASGDAFTRGFARPPAAADSRHQTGGESGPLSRRGEPQPRPARQKRHVARASSTQSSGGKRSRSAARDADRAVRMQERPLFQAAASRSALTARSSQQRNQGRDPAAIASRGRAAQGANVARTRTPSTAPGACDRRPGQSQNVPVISYDRLSPARLNGQDLTSRSTTMRGGRVAGTALLKRCRQDHPQVVRSTARRPDKQTPKLFKAGRPSVRTASHHRQEYGHSGLESRPGSERDELSGAHGR